MDKQIELSIAGFRLEPIIEMCGRASRYQVISYEFKPRNALKCVTRISKFSKNPMNSKVAIEPRIVTLKIL